MWKLCGFLLFLSSAGDNVSTELALTRPGVVETNPLMTDIRIRIPVHFAGTVFIWYATEWLYNWNPVVAWIVRGVAVAAFTFATVNNTMIWRAPG